MKWRPLFLSLQPVFFLVMSLALAVFMQFSGERVLLAQEITSGKPDLSPVYVLLIDGQGTHNWRESTPILKKDLEETGLFEVTVLTAPSEWEDAAEFEPNFSGFDVILLNYCGAQWTPAVEDALMTFVANGGGLVLYHGANAAFPNWPEFQAMLGVTGWGGRTAAYGPYRFWDSARQTMVQLTADGPTGTLERSREFVLRNCAPNHPIMRGLPEQMLHGPDELYQNLRGIPQNADSVTVLAAAGTASPEGDGESVMDSATGTATGTATTSRQEVQLAAVEFGNGRVFQILYGHGGKQCRSVAFIVPFLRGTQWAATGTVTIPVPEDIPTEDKSYSRP